MFAIENKTFPKTNELENALTSALTHCQTQIDSSNLPWCYFDLANILFLTGKPFEKTLRDAAAQATADWQIETARKTYELLIETNTMKNEAELALAILDDNKQLK